MASQSTEPVAAAQCCNVADSSSKHTDALHYAAWHTLLQAGPPMQGKAETCSLWRGPTAGSPSVHPCS